MNNNIIFFNNSVSACGVYQYGKRTCEILKDSKLYNFIYLEVNDQESVNRAIELYEPKVCIFNYHPATMYWLAEKNSKVKEIALVHENQIYDFDAHIHLDPSFQEFENHHKVVRPIFNYETWDTNTSGIPSIGSFGFGFDNKGFDRICKIVNEQFDEAIINLNITMSYYCGNVQEQEFIKRKCISEITKPNIKLNITSDFLSDAETLDFLSRNDINIFAYHYLEGRGASSVLDYAISLDRPIGLSDSYMFRHVNYKYKNLFSIDSNSIASLIDGPISHIQEIRKDWSHQNLIAGYEKIIEKINKTHIIKYD